MEVTISIGKLFKAHQFVIPLYQRNYAWGEVEVLQLLNDVRDNVNKNDAYYIGTLTVDGRGDGSWEVIDGQQRLTTLTLINAVARYLQEGTSTVPALSFDAREDIQTFIGLLYRNYPQAKLYISEDVGLAAIRAAVLTIENFFRTRVNNLEAYLSYFYRCVKIIMADVPKGTDINHYFEIMNNRGEQLEQHEVLKARLLDTIKRKTCYAQYALVWDACSQMDKPVQAAFSKENRKKLFGEDYTAEAPQADIEQLVLAANGEVPDNRTLLSILDGEETKVVEEEVWTDSRYKSIIDFPNFLLQVLKLTKNGNVSLDDKLLLHAFEHYMNSDAVMSFLKDLLYYRILFDKYVLKRVEANDDWGWKLIKPVRYASGDKTQERLDFRGTFNDKDDEEEGDDKEFIMIQSMLHVASPGNNYKDWLFKVLQFFQSEKGVGSRTGYLLELKDIARERVVDIVGGAVIDPNAAIFRQGTNTPRLLFYYLDYLLWDLYYKKTPHQLQQDIDSCKQAFANFRFTQNNSVEHVAPQTPADGEAPSLLLDRFGNLCLISSSTNSSLLNRSFAEKRIIFRQHKRKESLKQAIIFCNEEWEEDQMKAHEKLMLEVIQENLTEMAKRS